MPISDTGTPSILKSTADRRELHPVAISPPAPTSTNITYMTQKTGDWMISTTDGRGCSGRPWPGPPASRKRGAQVRARGLVLAYNLHCRPLFPYPVLTKENAFFVFVGIVAVIALNRWLQIGTVTRELLLATLLGPFLGVAILVVLVGGIDVLFAAYQLSVSKNYELPYAIVTGDGPWHRYLIDLLTVSPVVLILAFGAIFRLDAAKKSEIFCVVFIAASYLVMCNIKYGMNLRYADHVGHAVASPRLRPNRCFLRAVCSAIAR